MFMYVYKKKGGKKVVSLCVWGCEWGIFILFLKVFFVSFVCVCVCVGRGKKGSWQE